MNALKIAAVFYLLISGTLVALHRITIAAYPDLRGATPGDVLPLLMAAGIMILLMLSA